MRFLRFLVVGLYLFVATLPLAWMALSSVKDRADAISQNPRVVPTLASETDPESIFFPATLRPYEHLAEIHVGATQSFFSHLTNSVVIGLLSTLASVMLGTERAG